MPSSVSSISQSRVGQKRKASSLKENMHPGKKVIPLTPRTSARRKAAFFHQMIAPVKRPALFDLTSGSITNTLPSRLPPTPDASPDHFFKSNKKRRFSPPEPSNDFFPSSQITLVEEDEEEDVEEEEEEHIPFPTLRPLVRKQRFDIGNRLLDRCLEGSWGSRSSGFHYGDWKMETQGFYSTPADVHTMVSSDGRHVMPFSTATLNRSPIVLIGDEAGNVRLISTDKESDKSVFKGYKGFSTALATLSCHENAVFDLSVTDDDGRLATASGDQTVRVFDLKTQSCTALLSFHEASVKQVSFNPSNPSLLITSSRDSDVHLWDLRVSGSESPSQPGVTMYRPVKSIYKAHVTTLDQNHKSVTAAKWLYNSDNLIVTACESNANIKVWDIRSLQYRRNAQPSPVEMSGLPPHHNFKPHRNYGITSLNLSADGSRMYALCKDSVVYAYSTSHISNGPIHAYSSPKLRTASFYVKSSLSKDGRVLATGSSDGSVMLFPTEERYLDKGIYGDNVDIETNYGTNTSSAMVGKELKMGKGTALVRGHEKEVTGVVWAQNGDLVSISDDFTARCWKDGYTGTEAEALRNGGEDEGRRWGCGWAEAE